MNAGVTTIGTKSTGAERIASVRISGGGEGANNSARSGIQGDVEACGGDSPGDRLEEDATTIAMPYNFFAALAAATVISGAFAATSP